MAPRSQQLTETNKGCSRDTDCRDGVLAAVTTLANGRAECPIRRGSAAIPANPDAQSVIRRAAASERARHDRTIPRHRPEREDE